MPSWALRQRVIGRSWQARCDWTSPRATDPPRRFGTLYQALAFHQSTGLGLGQRGAATKPSVRLHLAGSEAQQFAAWSLHDSAVSPCVGAETTRVAMWSAIAGLPQAQQAPLLLGLAVAVLLALAATLLARASLQRRHARAAAAADRSNGSSDKGSSKREQGLLAAEPSPCQPAAAPAAEAAMPPATPDPTAPRQATGEELPAAASALAAAPPAGQQLSLPVLPRKLARTALPDGEHEVAFGDGSVYCGEWRGGRMHGRGVFRWPGGAGPEGVLGRTGAAARHATPCHALPLRTAAAATALLWPKCTCTPGAACRPA